MLFRSEPRANDVLVQIKACGFVPNLGNVLTHWQTWFPELPLPKLPAIFGLDVSGVVAKVGSLVQKFKPGDRVYVNPALSCGSCRSCRENKPLTCNNLTFQGYFGFGPESQKQFDAYPYGGFAEYKLAPQANLVHLPASVSFEQAARFGYLGTAYAALEKGGAGPGDTLYINGITGTLGLGACLIALGRGVTRIIGTARNRQLMARVQALSPKRIHVLSLEEGRIPQRVRELTDGLGADAGIDCLGPGSPASSFNEGVMSMRRGCSYVNCGGMGEPVPVNVHWTMDSQISVVGSNWFSAGQGQAMADMADAGTLDLSVFEHNIYKLTDINAALAAIPTRNGGFTNFIVQP